MARITQFIVGSCRHPECMVLQGGSFRSREFPSRAYLIEAGEERVLWDTGYADHFFQQAKGIYRAYAKVTPVHLPPAEGLLEQLRGHGLGVGDLSVIAVSHFHADHVAGLADFKGVPVVASWAAWESIKGVTGLRALLRAHIPALVPDWVAERRVDMDMLRTVRLPPQLFPFIEGYALTLDGSVVAVPLPGHARGHMGAFVRTDAGWELLASDAAWDRRAYEEMRMPNDLAFLIQDSRAEYQTTLKKLHHLHNKGVRIRLSHEPRQLA